MKKILTPLKVGILAVVTITGTIFALRSVDQSILGGGDTYRVYAILENVLGVAERSRVVMAGIEIGYIESIELEGAKARLNLRIREDVPLYKDATLAKISESLLGDKLIDISPGNDVENPLRDGGQILNIYEEKDFSELFRKLDLITGDIRAVTHSLRDTIGKFDQDDSLGGVMRRMIEISDNVAKLTRDVNGVFERGSRKVEQILDDVAGVTAGTRGRYAEILDNIKEVSADMKVLVGNLNDIVGRGENDWKESVSGVKDTLEKASRTLDNLDSITSKIDRGEGTLGRLVNDDKMISTAEGVLEDAASFTRPLARLKIGIDLRSEYHVRSNAAKNYLALKLMPKSDKYYMIELIDDPRGEVSVVEECQDPDVNPDNCLPENRTKKITVTDDFKWSVQFAKRYYFVGLRFGIIEGTGGLGFNLFFFDDDLEFKVDLFQFGKNEFGISALPRLKAMVMYRPTWLTDHVYLAAGGDDFLNSEVFDYFFGAGIHFTDDDLKAIFTAVGTPSL
ncbi:MAG: MCE family protein [Deltaproteobacteria bacterium]|nr:MCE family protein [Deltaproteobacteria bacterium]